MGVEKVDVNSKINIDPNDINNDTENAYNINTKSVVVIVEDLALHHYLHVLAGRDGIIHFLPSNESLRKNSIEMFSNRGNVQISGRVLNYYYDRRVNRKSNEIDDNNNNCDKNDDDDDDDDDDNKSTSNNGDENKSCNMVISGKECNENKNSRMDDRNQFGREIDGMFQYFIESENANNVENDEETDAIIRQNEHERENEIDIKNCYSNRNKKISENVDESKIENSEKNKMEKDDASVIVDMCGAWVGCWSEGALWTQILFLLMWDQVNRIGQY